MIFTGEKMRQIAADVERMTTDYHTRLSDPPVGKKAPISHYCLFWSMFAVRRIRSEGVKAILQAGTAQWTGNNDPKAEFPRWGYVWEWDATAVKCLFDGNLPPMHVWVCVPPQNGHEAEIVDMTTRFVKGRAVESGYDWTAPDLPPWIWFDINNQPSGTCYTADRRACQIANEYARVSLEYDAMMQLLL